MVAENVERLKRIVDDVMEVAPGRRRRKPARSTPPRRSPRSAASGRAPPASQLGDAGVLHVELAGASRSAWCSTPSTCAACSSTCSTTRAATPATSPARSVLRAARRRTSRAPCSASRATARRSPPTSSATCSSRSSRRAAAAAGLGLYICRELCERYGAQHRLPAAAARASRDRNEFLRRRCAAPPLPAVPKLDLHLDPMTTASHFSLLVVDDEPDLRTLYELTLLREGYDVEPPARSQEALLHLKDRTYSAVITDMRLPDGTGLDLLRWLEETGRREKAIVITAYGSAENAVEALKAGAYDYLTKPVDLKQFRGVVASALGRGGSARRRSTRRACRRSSAAARRDAGARGRPRRRRRRCRRARRSRRMAGNSTAMQQVRSLVEKVARSMAPVLVRGESGTGKELVARAIHEVSARGAMPFVAGQLQRHPEQLLEAEFFGYRKGAFTGANDDREGFFQAAHGGTLFLDEIGDLPLSMQSQAAARDPGALGAAGRRGRPSSRSTCASLSATHKDLGAEVQAGQLPPGSVLPPERHPDPRAAAARAARGPAGDLRARARAHRARRRRLAAAAADARRAGAPVALSASRATCASSRTCCTAPWRCRAARSSTSTTSACRSRCSPTARRRSSTGSPTPTASAAEPRRSAPQPAGRGAAARATWPRYLDEVERDILVRALEHHRFNRTAAGISLGLSLRQMRYRMARLDVNVGGDLPGPIASERARQRLTAARRRGGAAGCGARGASTRRTSARGPTGTAIELVVHPFDQPAAGRVRRRRDRAAVHQPARLGRASLLRDDPRPARCRRTS